MVNKAKDDKKAADEAKGEKTQTMKDMMAAARAEKEKKKEAAALGRILGTKEDTKDIEVFTKEMKKLAEQKEKDILAGNRGEIPTLEATPEQKAECDRLVAEYNLEFNKQNSMIISNAERL